VNLGLAEPTGEERELPIEGLDAPLKLSYDSKFSTATSISPTFGLVRCKLQAALQQGEREPLVLLRYRR